MTKRHIIIEEEDLKKLTSKENVKIKSKSPDPNVSTIEVELSMFDESAEVYLDKAKRDQLKSDVSVTTIAQGHSVRIAISNVIKRLRVISFFDRAQL
jgi:hypothetical protein